MTMHTPILGAVIALVLWSFVMWTWLYAMRIPAIKKLGITYDRNQPNSAFTERMPPRARWAADNYNHLMEQPTIFYATAITLSLLGAGGGLHALLAWAYVAVRVAHSLVHALSNVVMVRFAVFTVGSLILLAMAIDAALILLSGPAA
jgi:hypothetical protein